MLNVTNGTVNLGGSLTTAGLGVVNQKGGTIYFTGTITAVLSQVGACMLPDHAQDSLAFLGHGCNYPDGLHNYSPGCDLSIICILRSLSPGKAQIA